MRGGWFRGWDFEGGRWSEVSWLGCFLEGERKDMVFNCGLDRGRGKRGLSDGTYRREHDSLSSRVCLTRSVVGNKSVLVLVMIVRPRSVVV